MNAIHAFKRLVRPLLCFLFGASLLAGETAEAAVSDFIRNQAATQGRALLEAARAMPADRYGYAPDPTQMTFGALVLHVAVGNYLFCSKIGGAPEPARKPSAPGESKDLLVQRLQDSFDFCTRSLASLDDAKLSEVLDVASVKMPRSMAILTLNGTWNTHLAMAQDYLSQNGQKTTAAR